MNSMQLVFIGIIFVAATVAGGIFLTQLAPGRTRKRLEAVGDGGYAEPSNAGAWIKTAVKLSGPFARLSLPKEGWEQSPLRRRFMNAGFRDDGAQMPYFAAKTVLAVALPAAVFLFVRLRPVALDESMLMALLLLVAAAGYYLPNVVLERLIANRQRVMFENFPDATDLMLVCVEAGLGLDAALAKVADEMRLKSEPLAEELQLVNLEMRAGNTREKALHNLAVRTGVEEVATFAGMLVQADRFGTSIGDSLRVFADEMRTRRKFRAEELAAKIPLKLLFPLVFFIFPSLLLVLLGPAFIQVYRILLPTLTGQQ